MDTESLAQSKLGENGSHVWEILCNLLLCCLSGLRYGV